MIIVNIRHDIEDKETQIAAENIQEAIHKIIDMHTISGFERDYFEQRGRLQAELATGWYYAEQR